MALVTALGPPSLEVLERVQVEVVWDAIEEALAPLRSPILQNGELLGFGNASDTIEHFASPLLLGENVLGDDS